MVAATGLAGFVTNPSASLSRMEPLCSCTYINQSDSIAVKVAWTLTRRVLCGVTTRQRNQNVPGVTRNREWVFGLIIQSMIHIFDYWCGAYSSIKITDCQAGWALQEVEHGRHRKPRSGYSMVARYRVVCIDSIRSPMAYDVWCTAIIPGEACWVNVQGSGTYADTLVVP